MTPHLGERFERRTFGPLTRTDFVRYAGASGDFNPIHHDEIYAVGAGFPSVFSVGMLQAAILGAYVTDLFGPENVRRFAVRFKEQVWPDDILTCVAEVAEVKPDDGIVVLTLQCLRQTGGVAIQGTAEIAASPVGPEPAVG